MSTTPQLTRDVDFLMTVFSGVTPVDTPPQIIAYGPRGPRGLSGGEASGVTFNPDGDITATDVQAAIVEVRDDTDGKLGSFSTSVDDALALKANQSDLADHVTDHNNPHAVTKAQVGLVNVDNTSDALKPLSNAAVTALATKADDTSVVKLSGAQTIAGTKTFSSAPVVPDASFAISKVINLSTQLATFEQSVNKNAASGYAGLDATGKIPASLLPSFVDDVLEAANFAALPATGEPGKIYVTLDTNKTYRWSGSVYVEISASPGSTDSVPEGSINQYFTVARARGAAVDDSISDGVTDVAPSQNAVFDALSAKQPLSADLTTLAGLSPADGSIIQRQAGVWGTRTPTQFKTDLSLTKADVGLSNLDNTSDANKPISTAQAAGISKVRSTTLTVDVSLYPADVTVSGTADQTAINTALGSLSQGEVYVRTNLYLTGPISITKSNVKLRFAPGVKVTAAASFTGGMIEFTGQATSASGLSNVLVEGSNTVFDCGGFGNVQAFVVKGGTYNSSDPPYVDGIKFVGISVRNQGSNAGNIGLATMYSGRSITGSQDRGTVSNVEFWNCDFGLASKYHVYVYGNSFKALRFYNCKFHDGLTQFSFGWSQPAKRDDSLSAIRSNEDLLFHECQWYSMNSSAVAGYMINDVVRTGWRGVRVVGGKVKGHGIAFNAGTSAANQEYFINIHSASNVQIEGTTFVDVKTLFSFGQSNNGNYWQRDPVVGLSIKNVKAIRCYNFADFDSAANVDIDGLELREMYLNVNLGYSSHTLNSFRNVKIYNPIGYEPTNPTTPSQLTAAIYATPDGQEISDVTIRDDRKLADPTTAPVLTAVTQSGAPGGTFYFGYTWANDTGETNLSAIATITVSAGQTVQVTHPYSSTYGVPQGAKQVVFYGGTTAVASALTKQDYSPTPWQLDVETDHATTYKAMFWLMPTAGLTTAGTAPPSSNSTHSRVQAGIWEISGGALAGPSSRYHDISFLGVPSGQEIMPTAGSNSIQWDNISNPSLAAGADVNIRASKSAQYYNVLDYGAKGNGSADDTTAIQSAINAAFAAGGGVVYFPASTYFITAELLLKSNVFLLGTGIGSVVTGNFTTDSAGLIRINVASNMQIRLLKFAITSGKATAIRSTGHTSLRVTECDFSSTTTNFGGVIFLDGGSANAVFKDTYIEHNTFHDIAVSSSATVIHLYAKFGWSITNTQICQNTFRNITGSCTYVNATSTAGVFDVSIYKNNYYEIAGNGTVGGPGVVLLTSTSSSYQLDTLTIEGNTYRNTTNTTSQSQGLAYVYAAKNVKIIGNNAQGAWTPSTNVQGPFIAPGRTNLPVTNMVVQGNTIKGFDAAWDPDSMKNVVVSSNEVENCGGGFSLGYNVQENVRVERNVLRNSVAGGSYSAGLLFGNSNAIKCTWKDNTIVDDRSIQAPSGFTAALASGGTLTSGTTQYYVITALDDYGETIKSTEVSATPTGTTLSVKLSWKRVIGATGGYKIYRTATSGTYGATSLVAQVYTGTLKIGSYTDAGVTLTTGSPPTTSTVASSVMTAAIELTGNYDFSDVEVSGNRFHLPNGTFSRGFFVRELGSEAFPALIGANELHDSTGRVTVGGASPSAKTTQTGSYQLTVVDKLVPFSLSSAATATLPDATTCESAEFEIVLVSSGNTLTIATSAGQTINGSSTQLLSTQYKYIRVKAVAGNWIIIGGN